MELPQTSLDKLASTFKALGVQAPSLLTKIGILRALFIEIECAKKDGYSYGLILEKLITNGLKATTLNQFYGLINRIRLERGFVHLVDKSEEKKALAAPDFLDRSRRSVDREKSENKTIKPLNPQTQPNESTTPSNSATQEELKRIARGKIDPNQYLDE